MTGIADGKLFPRLTPNPGCGPILASTGNPIDKPPVSDTMSGLRRKGRDSIIPGSDNPYVPGTSLRKSVDLTDIPSM